MSFYGQERPEEEQIRRLRSVVRWGKDAKRHEERYVLDKYRC